MIYEDINIGLAVTAGESLVIPTVYGCDRLDLLIIVKKRNELVQKARDSKLALEEVSNGTFTITNLGMYGIRSSVLTTNPPQSAIIAIGEIYSGPVVGEDEYFIRSFMKMTLSWDHRIINGDKAAKFLKDLKEKMENPLSIFI